MAAAAAAVRSPLSINEDSTGAPLGQDPKNPRRDEKVSRMGTASIPMLITEFAIPAILGMMVNGAYNIIDSIFMGQYVGELGLATATVANPIMTLFAAVAMLVGTGGNALAALRMGEGDRLGAERSLGNTVMLSLGISAVVFVLVHVAPVMDALLSVSGATPEDWEYARSFIGIIASGFVFQCIGFGVNNFIRTAGAPNRALLTMVVGAVSCTALNYLFVGLFGWGVEGSAFATVLGQAISCICVLWYFLITKNVPLKLHLRFFKPHAKTVGLIVSLGLSSFAMQAGMAVVNFILNTMLSTYGAMHPIGAEGALASIGVVQRVSMFVMIPLIGINVAIQPLLGFNYGAQLIARVRKVLLCGIAAATSLAVLSWALVHVFSGQIVSIFGIEGDAMRTFTVFALNVQLIMMPLLGFQFVASGYFQATGQPVKSIVLSLTRQILFLIPLLFVLPDLIPQLFPQFSALDGLCFTLPTADVLSVVTTAVFFFLEMARLRKMERGEIAGKRIGVQESECPNV